MAFLAFADEYTEFRVATFEAFRSDLREALDAHDVDYALHSLYPVILVDLGDAALVASLQQHCRAFSLAAIPDEPEVLRLFPTPTNHAIIDHIQAFLDALRAA